MLPPDATIESVLSLLKNPEKYVSRALERMHECATTHGNAYVRIGIDSKEGLYPSFRVVFDQDGQETVYDSYNDNGTSFPAPYNKVTPGRWSSERMGLLEIAALQGKIPNA